MNFRNAVNRRKMRQDGPLVNMTPLVDIVFLLLIFFMVSTTFTKESRLELVLPQSQSELQLYEQPVIEIIISASGSYRINERALVNNQRSTLLVAVTKILGDKSTLPVMISADAQTPHNLVVRALDVASQLGLHNISITTQQ